MKNRTLLITVLGITLVISQLSAHAFTTNDPTFGVELDIGSEDQMDIMICNYTSGLLQWCPATSCSRANDAHYSVYAGYTAQGFTAFPGDVPSASSSLMSMKWDSIDSSDNPPPWFTAPYCILSSNVQPRYFYLMVYPQKVHPLLTDLEFAYHVMAAIGDGVAMAYGDPEAAESFKKNIGAAIREGNEIANQKDRAWGGISAGGDENLWSDPGALTYPIIYEMVGGQYVLGSSSSDHIAFDIAGDYVIQLVTVNSPYPLSQNNQLVVNVYTRDQWNQQQDPYGYIGWWTDPSYDVPYTVSGGPGVDPRAPVSIAYDGTVINVRGSADPALAVYNLYYIYGASDPDTLSFGWWNAPPQPYSSGLCPSVAISSSITSQGVVVVEVHQDGRPSGLGPNEIHYRYGIIAPGSQSINWGDTQEIIQGTGEGGKGGVNPSVAVSSDGTAILVYGGAETEELYYAVGTVDVGAASVTWHLEKNPISGEEYGYYYDTGVSPSVALMDDKTVIEVHQSENAHTLYYRLGNINADGKTITWWPNGSIEYDSNGVEPSVAVTADGTIVESHTGVFYRMGKLDRTNYVIDWAQKDSDQDGVSPSVAVNANGYLIQTRVEDDGDVYVRPGLIIGGP